MYRLTVVVGPGRGTSFKLKEGESTIGRQLGNTVVLPSAQVSKCHCTLVASNGQILVRDQESSNGTFINGVLSKSKTIRSGDRIGVGEYVLELTAKKPDAPAPERASSNVIQMSGHKSITGGSRLIEPLVVTDEELAGNEMPKDLKGRAMWAFESFIMPFFYGLNLKQEWRMICGMIFVGFLLLNLLVSVQPMLAENSEIILRESARRASFMAREIAERNAPFLAAGFETKTEIGLPERSDGVTLAALTDLDLRVIAPAQRMNQYLTSGDEVRFAQSAAVAFRGGRETGVHRALGDTVVAVEPVKVTKDGKNVTIAMAIVAVDASTSMMGMGEVGVVYSETLIFTGLLGAFALFVLYRLTLKRFFVLNEDMDKALKGSIPQVTHEFKMEELNPLWDIINSSLQRIPRTSSQGSPGDQTNSGVELKSDQYIGPVKMLADSLGVGVVICGPDRRVVFLNESFSRDTGIREETALGNEFTSLGMDESLGKIVQDLFDRSKAGGEAVVDETEFSGTRFQLIASAFGSSEDTTPRAFLIAAIRKAD